MPCSVRSSAIRNNGGCCRKSRQITTDYTLQCNCIGTKIDTIRQMHVPDVVSVVERLPLWIRSFPPGRLPDKVRPESRQNRFLPGCFRPDSSVFQDCSSVVFGWKTPSSCRLFLLSSWFPCSCCQMCGPGWPCTGEMRNTLQPGLIRRNLSWKSSNYSMWFDTI